MQVVTSSQKKRVLEACHGELGGPWAFWKKVLPPFRAGGVYQAASTEMKPGNKQGKTSLKLEERFERPDCNQFLKSYSLNSDITGLEWSRMSRSGVKGVTNVSEPIGMHY